MTGLPAFYRRCAQADDALSHSSQAAGQAIFVTDGQPYPFWDFVGDLLEPLGYGRPSVRLPASLIYSVAWIFQHIITPLVSPGLWPCLRTTRCL